MTIKPNENHRPGRMLAALIASDNKKGRMELTVRLTPADGSPALHRSFTIKKWTPKAGAARLFVALPDTAAWDAGVKPVTPLVVNLETGEVRADVRDTRVTKLLTYAATAALHYARTGECLTPTNGTVEVKEASICGHCGLKLTDPVSIERGIGPVCLNKKTGSKAAPLGKPTLVEQAQALAAPHKGEEIAEAREAVARAEARIAGGDHSEAAYDGRDEAGKWLFKATMETAA